MMRKIRKCEQWHFTILSSYCNISRRWKFAEEGIFFMHTEIQDYDAGQFLIGCY